MARYVDEGARAVLVCCTGGEEGEVSTTRWTGPRCTPTSRGVRRVELERSGRDHRVSRAVLARLPRLGHARERGQRASRVVRPSRSRRGGGSPRRHHQGRATSRDRDLQQRSAGLSTPRSHPGSTTSRHLPSIWPAIPTRIPRRASLDAQKMYFTVWSRERITKLHEKFLELASSRPTASGGSPGRLRTPRSPPRSRSGSGSIVAATPCGPIAPRSTRRRRSGSASPTRSPVRSIRGDDYVLAESRVPTSIPEDDLFAGLRDRG